ncbi:MAG: hypothetical protein ACPGUY_03825, partial [Akkermansiaceae bacterium]
LGTWKYLKDHSREFTADGFCILRSGKKVEWKKRVTSATKDSITVEGRYQHILKGDTLHIEGRYQAKR